jgi:hypothetical protein
MARPINAGFTPAQIIQQYEYYQYPVQQLVASLGAKEQQQEKAIESLSSFDSELGKYSALPGDEANKQKVLKDYNTLKDVTANQDLTNKTGRKALMDFKTSLTSDIFPKLTKYNASAEKFKENYKQETEKLAKGESTPHTLARLNDMGNSWNSDANGVFTGLQRGKYMPAAAYAKEFHPELLKGGWDPSTVNDWTKIFDDKYSSSYQNTLFKTISKEDLLAFYEGWKGYLNSQGYLDDFKYTLQKNFTPEDAALQAVTIAKEKTKSDFNVVKNEIASYTGTAQEVGNVARVLNIPETLASQFIKSKGKDEKINSAIEQILVNDVTQKLSTLTPEQAASMGYSALTNEYLMNTEMSPILKMYAGKVTDIETKIRSEENFALKEALRRATAVAAAKESVKPYDEDELSFGVGAIVTSGEDASKYYTNDAIESFDSWATAMSNIASLGTDNSNQAVKLKNTNQRIANNAQSDLNLLYNINGVQSLSSTGAKRLFGSIAGALRFGDDASSAAWQKAAGNILATRIAKGENITIKTVLNQVASLYRNKTNNREAIKTALKRDFFNPQITGLSVPSQGLQVTSPTTQLLGKVKNDFLDDVTVVYDGNKAISISPEEKKSSQVHLNGTIVYTNDDGDLVRYKLSSTDYENLQTIVEQRVETEKQKSRTTRGQERVAAVDLNLMYPSAYSAVNNLISGAVATNEVVVDAEDGLSLVLKKNNQGGQTFYTLIQRSASGDIPVTDDLYGDALGVMRAVHAYKNMQ